MKAMDFTNRQVEVKDDALKESEYTYDQKFKQLFQNKKFLVPILKNVVEEYKTLPLPEIEALIISVTGSEEVAVSIGTEDVGKGEEKKTYYDVLAGCRLPDTGSQIMVDLYFDLEMQREENPGYPLPKRGIYYCSRMLSRQLTNLDDADYRALKPVYSVWIIVNDIPEALKYSRYEVSLLGTSSLKDAAESYNTEQKTKYDRAVRKLDSQIDLIHLCLIFLSEDFADLGGAGDELIRYVQSVFIKKVGDPDYNPYADYSQSIQKEADEIMTIVGMFEARAEKRGMKIGEARGEAIGEARGEAIGEARGIINNGRRHSFSDDIIIEDIAAQTGCSFQDAEKILHDFDQAAL